ncbi:hypothetical protein ACFWYW_58810 [Nonomuraea sp. NPDC059023]|uniref:hypothetical protein n=1 Tax=unclassified Nonomuraea TaxID=2593643 RepID=UPI0036AE5BF0
MADNSIKAMLLPDYDPDNRPPLGVWSSEHWQKCFDYLARHGVTFDELTDAAEILDLPEIPVTTWGQDRVTIAALANLKRQADHALLAVEMSRRTGTFYELLIDVTRPRPHDTADFWEPWLRELLPDSDTEPPPDFPDVWFTDLWRARLRELAANDVPREDFNRLTARLDIPAVPERAWAQAVQRDDPDPSG